MSLCNVIRKAYFTYFIHVYMKSIQGVKGKKYFNKIFSFNSDSNNTKTTDRAKCSMYLHVKKGQWPVLILTNSLWANLPINLTLNVSNRAT